MQDPETTQEIPPEEEEWSDLGATRSQPVAAFLVRQLANGGLERVLLAHCQAARECGLSVRVLCLEQAGALAPRFREAGFSVEALGTSPQAWKAILPGIFGLFRWLQARRPCFLQVHMRRAGGLGRLVARMLGIPTLVALHNQDLPPPLWYRPFETWLDRESSFLAVSRSVRLHAQRTRLPGRVIHVLANSLPAPTRRSPARIQNRCPRIGFLGKLERKKGPDLFLQLARDVLQHYGPAEFVIAGSGPWDQRVRALAQESEVPVEFLGEVPQGRSFLASLDLACFPSRREGFGLAVGEALASGIPVLLADIPPFREVYGSLPEECFLLAGGPLRVNASRLWALVQDLRLREEVIRVGRILLDRYPESQTQAAYRQFYRDYCQQISVLNSAATW